MFLFPTKSLHNLCLCFVKNRKIYCSFKSLKPVPVFRISNTLLYSSEIYCTRHNYPIN